MSSSKAGEKITVYYDGACPSCVRDRRNYEKACGPRNNEVEWFDITDKDEELVELGINPERALKQLHVKDRSGRVVVELDAYILLMKHSFWLKPLSIFVSLPVIRPLLSKLYRYSVYKRLARSGRI